MCSLMLATCSYEGDTKFHPNAPRNVSGVWTAAGRDCRVLTLRSPNQMIIQNYHLMFVMFHVTMDIIVQTVSLFILQSWGTCEAFPNGLRTSQIESAQT
jgi:hypothetical protein